MPNINIDDVYILDETGAQVDKVTGLFTKDENTTNPEKAFAQLNIGTAGSNRNLLDNAYFVGGGSQLGDGVFPINQRGQTSYSWTGATCIDRWYIFAANDTVTLSASGLTLNANENGGAFGQRIKYYPEYSQKPILCTFLTTDDKRIVWSFTINTSISWQGGTLVLNEIPDFYVDALYDSSNNTVAFVLAKAFDNTPHSVTLKAAKLELGTVSTLANDAPPNFGEELRKCQRYLWFKTFSGNTQIGSGVALTADQAIVSVVTPASMRPAQNITLTANVLLVGNGQVATASAVTGINQYDNITRLTISSSGLTAHHTYSFFTTTETTMAIYAEI